MEGSEGQVAAPQTQGGDDGGDDDGDDEGGDSGVSDSVARLTERLDRFLDRVGPGEDDQGGGLGDLAFGADGDLDDDDDDFDDSVFYDDDDDIDADDAMAEEERRAREILDQYVEQRTQEQIAPVLEEFREQQRYAQITDLEDRYPELQSREMAAPLMQAAQELAAALGQPELAYEAPFLETVYLRAKAEVAAASEDEGGEGGSETPLEKVGSASTGGGEEVDLADEIVKARQGGASRSYLVG
jgi:hypothetical protein